MQSVSARKHVFGFYFSVLFLFLFSAGIGIIMMLISLKSSSNTSPVFLYIFSVGCFTIAIYSVVRYYKNAPTIYVDNLVIKLNDKVYPWDNIQKIMLTGKQPFKYIITHDMEGICLKAKDGNAIYLFDDLYSNLWQVKSFIKQIVIDKASYYKQDVIEIGKEDIDNGQFQFFKGNTVYSFRGVLLWGGIASFFSMSIVAGNYSITSLTILSIICILWFMFQSAMMDYFGLSANYFIIKNHSFFWKSNVYVLDNIKEITFETRDKLPNCLRVVTTDFKTKLYRRNFNR